MAAIHTTQDEWVDIVFSFLLDAMIKDKEVLPDNESLHLMIEKMKLCGLKPHLLRHYMNASANTRTKYKVLRKSFTQGSKTTINISKNKDQSSFKSIELKDIVKKALKLIKAHKRRVHGMPLNEETVDNIIEKVIKESNNG